MLNDSVPGVVLFGAVLLLGEAVCNRRALDLEREKSERLLLNVLPVLNDLFSVFDQLARAGGGEDQDHPRLHPGHRTWERLRDRYRFERRGPIPVKGKGAMVTYFLVERANRARN